MLSILTGRGANLPFPNVIDARWLELWLAVVPQEDCDMTKMTNGNAEEEYKDVSSNVGYYGSMRFVLLTLFGTFSATIMAALFLATTPLKLPSQVILKALGVLLVLVFGSMDQRASEYWGTFWRRAVELEAKLNYSQYKARSHRRIISITNATRLLYLAC